MKKFQTNVAKTAEADMPRTNYCPIYRTAETADPIDNNWNPEGLTSEHTVKKLTKNEATLKVKIYKEGTLYADATFTYNTREGQLRDDDQIKLASKEYSANTDYYRRKKLVRKYLIGLVREFSILNDLELKKALNRPDPEVAAEKAEKRPYERVEKNYQRKGFYRNRYGKTFYVRATTVLPN